MRWTEIVDVRRHGLVGVALFWAFIVIVGFPYDTDSPQRNSGPVELVNYYNNALTMPDVKTYEPTFDGTHEAVKQAVTQFVAANRLDGKHVLEVGSGTGYLQDVVNDYTGLDIAGEDRRFYHKRFVVGSATELPFGAGEFDSTWSIYTFEHVINPERGLSEMRRVTKDGGLLFLLPAWNCPSWAAEGYEVRSYSNFGLGGKIIKASVPVRANPLIQAAYLMPIRSIQWLSAQWFAPIRLRYTRLIPNYSRYWVPDSDAVNSLDRYETELWFRSRGDECVNCGAWVDFWRQDGALILRVHKR